MWIIGLIVFGLIVIAIASAAGEAAAEDAQKQSAAQQAAASRAAAYADYLMRTSSDPAIRAMTPREIHDLIATNMREFDQDRSTAGNVAGAISALGLIVGVVVWVNSGFVSGAIWFGIGLGVAWAVGNQIETSASAKVAARGLDPSRLAI